MATQVKNVYRKTKEGSWAVMGPVDVITPGATVTVTKNNGETKQETIASIGKPFKVEGREMVYGYLAPAANSPRVRETCAECGERPGTKLCYDSSGLSGMCCSRCAGYSPYERSFG